MRIGDAVAHFDAVEVQAGKVARIGLVAEAAIDRVGAGVDRGAQPGRRSGGTNQLERSRHGAIFPLAGPIGPGSIERLAQTIEDGVGRLVERGLQGTWNADHGRRIELGVVQRIAQRENGFGVALDDEIAREEQGVTVIGTVEHAEQHHHRRGNARGVTLAVQVAHQPERRATVRKVIRNANGQSTGSIAKVKPAYSPSRAAKDGRAAMALAASRPQITSSGSVGMMPISRPNAAGRCPRMMRPAQPRMGIMDLDVYGISDREDLTQVNARPFGRF